MSTSDPLEMLTAEQLAGLLQISEVTLAGWRSSTNQGIPAGPKFTKVGRAVRYRRADVEAWLARTTPEAGEQ